MSDEDDVNIPIDMDEVSNVYSFSSDGGAYYREDLDEWSSLNGLAILNMIDKKYGVKITASEIKETTTIEDVFNLVKSKM